MAQNQLSKLSIKLAGKFNASIPHSCKVWQVAKAKADEAKKYLKKRKYKKEGGGGEKEKANTAQR